MNQALAFPSGAATAEVLEDVYRGEPVGPGQCSRLPHREVRGVAGADARDRQRCRVRIRVRTLARLVARRTHEMYVLPVTFWGLALSNIVVGWPAARGCRLSRRRAHGDLARGRQLARVDRDRVAAGRGGDREADYFSLLDWLLFSGTGLMLGGTVGSVIGTWSDLRASLRDVSAAGGLRMTRGRSAALALGSVAVVALGTITFDVNPLIPLFALALSAVLCAAAVHAMGETDNTPAGPLGGFAQLVVGATAPGGTAALPRAAAW